LLNIICNFSIVQNNLVSKKYIIMADQNFKSGDCVQLKHGGGGIKMTINYIQPYGNLIRAHCK